jgi:hypothetical protein
MHIIFRSDAVMEFVLKDPTDLVSPSSNLKKETDPVPETLRFQVI